MEDEQQADWILRYLRGEMPEDEQAKFEQSLKDDPEFEKNYQFHKQLMQGQAYQFKQEKKAMLQELEKQKASASESSPSNVKGRKKLIYLTMFGGLAAAIALFVFLILPGKTAQELGNQYFEPFPDYTTPTYRGGSQKSSEESTGIFAAGMQAYRKSEYQSAIDQLQQAIAKGKKPNLSRFYQANALIAIDKPDQAVAKLQDLKDQLPKKYQIQQQWYLTLAYVQNDQPQKAQAILNQLVKKDHFQHKQAAKEIKQALE